MVLNTAKSLALKREFRYLLPKFERRFEPQLAGAIEMQLKRKVTLSDPRRPFISAPKTGGSAMTQRADKNDEIVLPGFKVRHQVELLARDWTGLLNLFRWLEEEKSQVAFVRSRSTKCGQFEVSLGVEGISAKSLNSAIGANNSFRCVRVEHLFVQDN